MSEWRECWLDLFDEMLLEAELISAFAFTWVSNWNNTYVCLCNAMAVVHYLRDSGFFVAIVG